MIGVGGSRRIHTQVVLDFIFVAFLFWLFGWMEDEDEEGGEGSFIASG